MVKMFEFIESSGPWGTTVHRPSKIAENPTLFGDFPGSQVHIREAVVDKKVPKNR